MNDCAQSVFCEYVAVNNDAAKGHAASNFKLGALRLNPMGKRKSTTKNRSKLCEEFGHDFCAECWLIAQLAVRSSGNGHKGASQPSRNKVDDLFVSVVREWKRVGERGRKMRWVLICKTMCAASLPADNTLQSLCQILPA